jgi:hypothetical protein
MEIDNLILITFLSYWGSLIILASQWSKRKPITRILLILLSIALAWLTGYLAWSSICAG